MVFSGDIAGNAQKTKCVNIHEKFEGSSLHIEQLSAGIKVCSLTCSTWVPVVWACRDHSARICVCVREYVLVSTNPFSTITQEHDHGCGKP